MFFFVVGRIDEEEVFLLSPLFLKIPGDKFQLL
jgi:hypothetical protein